MTDNPFRDLPAVDTLADHLGDGLARPLRVEAARKAIDLARLAIEAGNTPDVKEWAQGIASQMGRRSGTRVINATGVLLHTNLGRAPWSHTAIEAARQAADGYQNLELDLETGRRGQRGEHVALLLRMLTGAEDALVVNNNAAAVLLALAATAGGNAVPVSRGELIEIGGSYRLPEVMSASGARMVEVGTTNRTRLGDYQTALQTHECGAVLKIHPSNFRVTGFTETVAVEELAGICDTHGVPLIYDIGSGLLDASARWVPDWLADEPGARQAIQAGTGIVTFSGDKLLGGPQAGLIVGRQSLIETIRSHPLARSLRVGGVTYAALSATLIEYLEGEPNGIPFWAMALTDGTTLRRRCEMLGEMIGSQVEEGASAVGAGSAPGVEIPTPVLRVVGGHEQFECLLTGDPPILARREAGDLIIDLRAVEPEDDRAIADRLLKCR